jgi:preprotein translocase subunit YajC
VLGAAYAMGQQPQGGEGANPLLAFLPFILIFFLFYWFIIRPQSRKQKAHQALLKQLAKGERVVTSSGIYGTIVGIDDERDIVVLKIAENVKVEFQRGAIATVIRE